MGRSLEAFEGNEETVVQIGEKTQAKALALFPRLRPGEAQLDVSPVALDRILFVRLPSRKTSVSSV